MEIKPLDALTRKLRVVFLIYLGVSLLGVISSLYTWLEYSRLPGYADVSEMRGSDGLDLAVAFVAIPAFITVVIAWLVWCYRANVNLRLLSGVPMKFTPGWAVGWWFIPFANLVMPYRVVKEIWRVSHGPRSTSHALVGWWWALYLVSTFVDRVTWRVGWFATTVDDYVHGAAVGMISGTVQVVAISITIVLIARIRDAYANTVVEPKGAAQLASRAATSSAVVYGPPPGWYVDPWGRHELRFWDALRWSPYVIDGGVQALDPV